MDLVWRLQVKRGQRTSSKEVTETRECTLCAKPLMSCVTLAISLSCLSCMGQAAHSCVAAGYCSLTHSLMIRKHGINNNSLISPIDPIFTFWVEAQKVGPALLSNAGPR